MRLDEYARYDALGLGELGARIDDLIVVTEDGCRQLTAYPKEALFVVD